MEKKKISSVSTWDHLKKTRETLFEVEGFGTIKLKGITEGERKKAQQEATENNFNKERKEYEEKLNTDDFGYRLILAGWVEPAIPGETFEQKKEALQGLGYAHLQRIAGKINELSGISRGDTDALKNFLGLA